MTVTPIDKTQACNDFTPSDSLAVYQSGRTNIPCSKNIINQRIGVPTNHLESPK